MNPFDYAGAIISIVNIGIGSYLLYLHKKMKTPKYMAVFVNPTTKKTDHVKEIKNFSRVLNYKKQTYNIVSDRFVDVPNQNTKYFFYSIGQSDPIDLTEFDKSTLPADVYYGIIENELINKITKASSPIKLDQKMILYLVGGVLLFIFIMANGGL